MHLLKRLTMVLRNSIPTLALALLTLLSPQQATAQTILASDCSFGFKNVFFDNEPVCAVVQAGGSILGPPGVACVVPPGGQPADDVTPGGCNAVGVFLEEPILWLPPTTPGNYSVIVVNNQGGAAADNITIISSGGAPPTVNVAAIKAAAGMAAAPWQALADWGAYIDEFASAISIAWAVSSGDWVSAAVGIAGVITGQATDYNGAVLDQGGQIIAALAGVQAARYSSLQADPPDPVFTDIVPLDLGAINADLAALAPLNPGVPLQYPFANRTQDPLHLASTKLSNAMAEESAMVFALMRTLEKFQGAEAATDDQFTLLQARALKAYADQLGAQLATTRQGAVDYKAELTSAGLDAITYDSVDVAALIARLQATGLTAGEEQDLRDSGFEDADIQLLFDRVNGVPVPTGTFSRGGGLDAIVTAIDGLLPAVQDVGNQAQAVVDHFEPLVTEQHPSADAGGPYNGSEGVALIFDGSTSTDPQAQSLTFEWDFDLDGQFDDGVGAMPSNTFNAPGVTQIGLKVTDTDANSDIAYAAVVIADVNGPPVITSFIPIELVPTASNSSPLAFSATATDPDGDSVTFEWRLNGAVTSTANAWTYTPGLGETGTRTVRLTVSDLNALSEDTIETRLVQLIPPGGPDTDGDGVPDDVDNCTLDANPLQIDSNGDDIGNVCDADLNNDCDVNFLDLGAMKAVFFSNDADADLVGAGNSEPDGMVNFFDLGRMKATFFGQPGPSALGCDNDP